MREVRRDPAYLDDPVLQEYLLSIWQPLVAAARQQGDITPDIEANFAWEAFLVRDRSVNAFALPGGFVGVHLALIALTGAADELASVLAHELTHVTQRHIARSVTASSRQSLLALAGMIVGLIAASRANSPDAAQAAIMGSQAAAIQGQLNFSRDMEREADRIGMSVLGQAGFAPSGMARMFETSRPRQPAGRQRLVPVPAQPPAHHRARGRGARAPRAPPPPASWCDPNIR